MVVKRKIIGAHDVSLMCDICGVQMECRETLMSNPPQYVYQCPQCGDRMTTMERYPHIEFEYEEDKHEST